MHAAGEKLCRMAVSKIMEPDPREVLHATDKAGELVGQAERLVRPAIGPRAQKGFAGLPDAESEKLLGLLSLEPAQILDGISGQGDDAMPPALRRLESNSRLRLLKAFHHAEHPALKVNVFNGLLRLPRAAFRSRTPATPANRRGYVRALLAGMPTGGA